MYNIIAIIIYLLSFIILFKRLNRNSILIIKLYVFFYVFIAIQISLILIEQGFYIYEQQIFGFPNNSSFFLSIFFFIFSWIIYRSDFNKNIVNKYFPSLTIKNISRNEIFLFIAILASFILLDFILIRILGYGSNRFDIYNGIPNKIYLIRLRIFILYLTLFYLVRCNSTTYRIIISIIVIIWAFIRYDITGAFLPLLLPWALVLTINNSKQKIPAQAYIGGIVIVVIILYLKMLQLDAFFISRLVLTGHVFWGSINELGNGDIYYQLSNYFNSFFNLQSFTTTKEYGNGYLMQMLAGSFSDSYIEKGIRFSHGMPAILLINFSILFSLILYYIFMFLYVKWISVYIRILFQSNIILFILAERINYVFKEFMLIGEIGLIHFKFILVVLAFLFIKSIFQQKKNFDNKNVKYNYAQ